ETKQKNAGKLIPLVIDNMTVSLTFLLSAIPLTSGYSGWMGLLKNIILWAAGLFIAAGFIVFLGIHPDELPASIANAVPPFLLRITLILIFLIAFALLVADITRRFSSVKKNVLSQQSKPKAIKITQESKALWLSRKKLELYVLACLLADKEPSRNLQAGGELIYYRMLKD
ncbi:MAG TPA: hypothetical protein DIS76_01020, partial [Rhodospirillaceae bacterium]|nr:hypothetical protein [Rhodospirillaceae bacterium]